MSSSEVAAVHEDRYRPVLANQGRSETLRNIYRDVYGADYPEEVEPFGFVTMTDLGVIAEYLSGYGVKNLVDIGCGRGGPGLWVARDVGASLHGVDIVAEALNEARQLAERMTEVQAATFQAASITETGQPDGVFDGAMSVDALWMVIDKMAAFEEMGRLLKPGSPLIFTTWAPPHFDYAWFMEPSGFSAIETREITGSGQRQNAVYDRIIREKDALARELGVEAGEVLVHEAAEAGRLLATVPRVMVQAIRA
ncbi:class I SAM-dependent methyltransferase [Streptomyces albidoflavus]